ncbi:MAG: O-antigen ligase family protein [Nibricoccus sp.]
MTLRTSKIETLTLLHVVVMGVLATWFLGGGSYSARLTLCVIGSLAPALLLAGLIDRRARGEPFFRSLLPLIPWFGFNIIVLLGLLHPSFRRATVEGITVFIPNATAGGWPESARPDLAVLELWLLNALILTPFNLLINVRHRSTLHTLFFILAVNALILAVFGSFQKFVDASGLFFGAVASPNTTFFSSFIYHNHWGAFVVLSLSICLGLLFSLRPWSGSRDFWHSPALAAVVAIFLLALAVPLSGARACTFLAALLLAAGFMQGLRRITSYQKDRGRSVIGPGFLVALTLLAVLTSTYFLAREVIETRLADTRAQLSEVRDTGSIGSRGVLYSDTWRMALDKPWFGWGLGSYATVFRSYNSQIGGEGLPHFYEYAHSDWLQLFAETGVVGTAFYLTFLILVLQPLRRWHGNNELPAYLLLGCGLIALYACIEFPFGNPAVTLIFWTCLMGSVRWVKLTATSLHR